MKRPDWWKWAALALLGPLVAFSCKSGTATRPFREPPPSDNPLFKLDNVVLTAHFAGPTWDNHAARLRNAFDNVERVHRGEAPLWVVPELAGGVDGAG